jgi:hypothetical protein
MLIVDWWTICIIISNLLHVLGFIFLLSQVEEVFVRQQDLMIGCGTGLCWLSLTKYLQYSPEMYALPATMLGAGRQILLALISSMPIFVGVAYFCMSLFGGYTGRFRSLEASLYQLWALSNGDEVQNIYHALIGPRLILGSLFCYVWVFFTNNGIMPLLLALSEDGFIKQAKDPKFSWLSDDLTDPVGDTLVNEPEAEEETPGACKEQVLSALNTQLINAQINSEGVNSRH